MLKPSQAAEMAPLVTSAGRQSFQVNSVVTKGKIRVAPRPGLQVVTSNTAETEDAADVADAAGHEALNSASWLQEAEISADEAEARPEARSGTSKSDDSHIGDPEISDPDAPDGPPMKLIKLVAAAAVLGVAATVLAVLQFAGSGDEALAEQNAAAAVVGVANAATVELSTDSGLVGQDGSDIVAQITAGTLAALRTTPNTGSKTGQVAGAVKASASASDPVPVAIGQAITTEAPNALYAMVLQAVQQGQSAYYIDQMVNEAYRANQVVVPAVLLTASGAVDTKTLLTLFVGQ